MRFRLDSWDPQKAYPGDGANASAAGVVSGHDRAHEVESRRGRRAFKTMLYVFPDEGLGRSRDDPRLLRRLLPDVRGAVPVWNRLGYAKADAAEAVAV